MTEKEVQEVLDELNAVRPEMLNESGKRLFDAIMKIADERDKANNIINKLEKYLIERIEYNQGSELQDYLENTYSTIYSELQELKGSD